MSKKTIIVAILSLSLVAVGAGLVQAHGGRSGGGAGYGYEGSGSGYGPGMMGYGQGMMGMMGYGGMRGHMGWDEGRGHMGYRGERYDRQERPNVNISQDEAKAMIELRVSRNPYLKVGKVTANDDGFEIQVVTKKGGDLVNRLQIEKSSGRIFPIFE